MNLLSRVSLLAIATASIVGPATAQDVQTNVVADTTLGRSLGTSISTIGNITTIDNGTVSGTNLFHSFANFDLGSGDVAQWVYSAGDASSITNVINRVTGGVPSSISGILDSTALPNADFYFVNPAGVLFGAGAEVNVPAAARFSTSSELRFANGDVFSIATPNGSTLSMAAPQSFGFLGGEGDIGFTDIENGVSTTFLPGGGTLTVAAADITLSNAFIGSNALALAAVGDMAAEVALDGTSADLLQGAISLANDSWLQTWPGGCFAACLGNAGTIRLEAGAIAIDNSNIVADFDSPVDPGGDRFVSLVATDTISVTDGAIMSNGYDAVSGGAVLIAAGSAVTLTNTQVSTYTAGSGNAGQIAITAPEISITGGSVGSETFSDGDAGEIYIAGDNLTVTGGSSISSTTDGSGAGGAIFLRLYGDMTLDASTITTTSNGVGDGGLISALVAGDISLAAGSRIAADAIGDGLAGSIEIGAAAITMAGESSLATNAEGTGDGGQIFVDVVGELSLTDSKVSSSSGVLDNPVGSTGRAGDILLTAGSLILDGGQIQVDAFDHGDGGSIFISVAGDIDMTAAPDGLGHISSNAWRNGDGGDVSIFAGGAVRIVEGGISSRAGIRIALTRGPGFGGNVNLTAASLEMTDAVIQSNARREADGGTVTLAISDMLTMDRSRISTISLGSGRAGQIDVEAGSAILIDSAIDSNAWETGDGGAVRFSALGLLSMNGGTISSSTLSATGAGAAGNVFVIADLLEMTNGAEIGSSAMGDGQGGSVAVDAAIAFITASNIQSNAHGLGDAGGISITSDTLDLADGSIVQSTSYGGGRGGSVAIMADHLFVTNGSLVAADSLNSGDAGDVFIDAFVVSLSGGAIIASRSAGSGNGGLVAIETDLLDMSETSWILTTAFDSGDAGNIVIAAGDVREQESTIDSTSYGDGAGGSIQFVVSGNMTVDASKIATNTSGIGDGGLISGLVAGHFAVVNDSNITANALGDGRAGDVELGAGTMTVAGSSIASNARGAGDGGNVLIAVDGLLKMDQGGISTNAGSAADGDQPAGNAGTVEVTAGSLDMRWSGIGSSAYDGGNGGAVGINVDGAMTMDLSNVTSDSTGTGDAGIVAIEAASLAMRGGSVITSDAILDGNAGLVLVNTLGDLVINGHSRISSNVGESFDGSSTGDAGAIAISARNLVMDEASIYSISFGNGDSGFVGVELTGGLSMSDSIISSDAAGELSNGGALFIEAASVTLERSSIAADTYADGNAGSVNVQALGALTLLDGSFISSDTLFGSGSGGDVTVEARDILLNGGSFISSVAYADGDGGFVDVTATNSLVMRGATAITTNVYGDGLGGAVFVNSPSILLTEGSFIASTAGELASGDAGDVFIEAGDLVMDGGSSIASDVDGSGESGFIELVVTQLDMSDGARISTQSMNANPAGYINIVADNLRLSGLGTSIASENLNPVEGGDNAAGSVFIAAGHVEIAEGARVATNSLTGIAGDITFDMPEGSLLVLGGVTNTGVIETSSGPGNGGIISISRPLAIISNGGTISALGESGGANVQIDTNYFIVSSDRLNTVKVDGTLAFTNAIYDVSAGTVDADLTIVDASGVLRNQCSAARASGELSQLQLRSIGPFGSARGREAEPVEQTVGSSGGCH